MKKQIVTLALLLLTFNVRAEYMLEYNWWGYEEPPTEEAEKEDGQHPATKKAAPAMAKAQAALDAAKALKPLPPPPSVQELMTLHPAVFKELDDAYRQNAVWLRTPEAVEYSVRIQTAMQKMATGYVSVQQHTLLTHPEYNSRAVAPITKVGNTAMVATRNKEVGDFLAKNAFRYEFIMFTEEGCRFCETQRGILKNLVFKNRMEYAEVDIRKRPEIAAKFGIEGVVPQIVIVERDTLESQPVAVGVTSRNEIERNAYRAIKLLKGGETQQYLMYDYQKGSIYDPEGGAK
jgi:conjugal transfer pilus assembly protein TraF